MKKSSILVYICGLMCSHLSAFRIAANIRKALVAHIAQLPLGFTGEMGGGKMRRIVNDSSAAAETYLAHQLPAGEGQKRCSSSPPHEDCGERRPDRGAGPRNRG